jgi:hypothetical protein
MDQLNAKFNSILEEKSRELSELAQLKSEKRKMTQSNINDMTYHDKKTLSKIAIEQDRKIKSSKAYKTTQQKIIDTRTIVVEDKTM